MLLFIIITQLKYREFSERQIAAKCWRGRGGKILKVREKNSLHVCIYVEKGDTHKLTEVNHRYVYVCMYMSNNTTGRRYRGQ